MKALAMYLPQYHEVKENNLWWGEGYTEWTAVKSAVSYIKGQVQPRVPLNKNYYDLSDPEAKAWQWQAKLAKEYGIYGFVIYHYWFKTGRQLLERPMEILLKHREIDINYCICWANESWTRTWYGIESETLMQQEYGDEKEWETHFNYLLQFFKDERYIKIDGKPMINIYHTYEISCMKEMLEVWNKLSIAYGFNGIYVVSGNTGAPLDYRNDLYDAYYNFEPGYTLIHKYSKIDRIQYFTTVFVRTMYNRFFHNKIIERPIGGRKITRRMLKDNIIKQVKIYPGAFPQWDNSPRRKYKGTFFKNMSAENFKVQIQQAKEKYPEAEFIYVNAWNEWGEGAYLEPDEVNKYKYLEVIQNEITSVSR